MTRKTKRGDWVVPGGAPGEIGYCTRCGEGLKLGLPQKVEFVVLCMKAFVKVHSKCQPGQYHEKPAHSPAEWAASRDTGVSSLTIYSAITGNPVPHVGVPRDPSDFGRCYRLLKLFPAWRSRLSETIKLCPQWKPFVAAWDELTQLYELELPLGSAPKMYARMQELQKGRAA